MTMFQSMAISLVGDAEHGDLAAVAHVGEHVAKAGRVARHFQADVEAFLHAELFLRLGQVLVRSRWPASRPSCGPVPGGKGLTSVTTTWRAPACRTTAAAMQPIGPGPGDQHVLAQHVERQGRVYRVAERIEDRLHVAGDGRIVHPDIGHRQRQILGKAPGRLTPTPCVSLHRCRRPARQLRQRPQTTCPSPLTTSPTWKSLDVGPDLDDLADELMADHHRHRNGLLGPGIPLVDVQIGAADAGAEHLDEHVVDADRGPGNVLEPQADFRLFLHQCEHDVPASSDSFRPV